MKGKFFKRAAAMALALAMLSGVMPFESVSDKLGMSVDTYAADTTTSDITVDGKVYKLFSGFTAINGTAGIRENLNYSNLVDNNTSSRWFTNTSPTYIIFKSDTAIVPAGYIINTYNATYFKPKSWKLYANQNETDNKDDTGWTLISEKNGISFDGTEGKFYCDTSGKYRCFKLEFTESTDGNIQTTEFGFFGYTDYTYTPVYQKAATCVETGIKQNCYVRNDGVYFADSEGKSELNNDDVIIPMLDHAPVYHKGTDTTVEYWQCSSCHKYFGDSLCTEELTEEQLNDVSTAVSEITVDDKIYKLYSGFTATNGTTGTGTYNYSNLVDNNTGTGWYVSCPAEIEFNSHKGIIPVGYNLIISDATYFKPKSWKIYAKRYKDEEWILIDEKNDVSFDSTEGTFYCNKIGEYRYFKFEVTASTMANKSLRINELQLFCRDAFNYTFVPSKAATCTETGISRDCWYRDDGKYFDDAYGTTELTDVVIPMLDHTPVYHDGTDTTVEYWQCSSCHKYFGDSLCTEELTEEQLNDVSTAVSELTVDNKIYKLYSGFETTSGRTGIGVYNYSNLVDNNTDTYWAVYCPAEIEFNSHKGIIPVGYKLIISDATYYKPKSWKIYAKRYKDEEWILIDEKNDVSFDGTEGTFYCDKIGEYRYFRFEATASTSASEILRINELQLFGYNAYTYTFLSQRAATCTEIGIKTACYSRADGKYFADENGENELNADDVIVPKLAHTPVHYDKTNEHIEYWQCSSCGNYFADANCTNQLPKACFVAKKSATCLETGISRDCYMRVDGKYFADEDCTEELTDAVVPKLAHIGIHHQASDNLPEYWQCSQCKRYFGNAEMTDELLLYLDENGTVRQLTDDYTVISDDTTELNEGWYVLNKDTVISNVIDVVGNAKLLLLNGATLDMNDSILIYRRSSLTIYAQTDERDEMGAINVSTTEYRPAIGGRAAGDYDSSESITINGGKINAYSSLNAGIAAPGSKPGHPGSITINGGIITAYGGKGSGIGASINEYTGNITINGGIISATGGDGTGIGSSSNGINDYAKITISDNVKAVYACGSGTNDAIGAGYRSVSGIDVLFLSGGTDVTAQKDEYFTDTNDNPRTIRSKKNIRNIIVADNIKNHINISPYSPAIGETVTLTADIAVDTDTLKANYGAVTLKSEENGKFSFVMPDADVSLTGDSLPCYTVTLPEGATTVSSSVSADMPGMYAAGTVITFKFEPYYTLKSDVTLDGKVLTETDGVYSVTVPETDITVEAVTERHTVIELSLTDSSFIAKDGDTLSGKTSYAVQIEDDAEITLRDANIGSGIVCLGSAAIVLDGENTVEAKQFKAGIRIGDEGTTLTIKGSGVLDVTGGTYGAAIGTDLLRDTSGSFGNIIFESGSIKANGGYYAAAVGLGRTTSVMKVNVSIGDVVIKGGNITAEAYSDTDGTYGGIGLYKNGLTEGSTLTTGKVIISNGIEKVDTNNINWDIEYYCGDTPIEDASEVETFFTVTQSDDRYTAVSKDNTDRKITADAAEDAIVFSKNTAKYGEKMTFYCKDGYFIESLSANDGAVIIEDNNDGTYSFRTPADDVTVKAWCVAYGDAGLDGKVDGKDATLVLKFISTDGQFFEDESQNAVAVKAANADGIGEVDILDVIKILQIAEENNNYSK